LNKLIKEINMAMAKANATPKVIPTIKPLGLAQKAGLEIQVHLRFSPDSATILSVLSKRYGYNSQSEYLDDVLPLIFEQEYGISFKKLSAPKKDVTIINAKAKK